ncbi:hypothetical protein SELMODRAFT_425076 [Selaginella moellendorffii]|uniref:Uncharacterized protein n=1 Tax=Selaginella moellendorffii TaxID=88036 RepID=D8SRY5_SELML|nr:hypothetical protein SELMODRAFT_425076 [Selaginella moellendorffii]
MNLIAIDWASVLTLSSEQMMFMDNFLELTYPFPLMHTSITFVPVFRDLPTHREMPLISIVKVARHQCSSRDKKEYGPYFVMSTELNGRSNDMFVAVDRFRGFLALDDRTGGNKEVVGAYVGCYLPAGWLLSNTAEPRVSSVSSGFCYRLLVGILIPAMMSSSIALGKIVALDKAPMAVIELAEFHFINPLVDNLKCVVIRFILSVIS